VQLQKVPMLLVLLDCVPAAQLMERGGGVGAWSHVRTEWWLFPFGEASFFYWPNLS
jgi:hypothetical protein